MEMPNYTTGAIGVGIPGAYAATPAPERDTLGSVANDMDTESERLQKLFGMLERIADHVDGVAPQQVDGNVTKMDTPPHSLLDTMRRRQRVIGLTISRCETAANRITGALGI
jgi:hypothetical protein